MHERLKRGTIVEFPDHQGSKVTTSGSFLHIANVNGQRSLIVKVPSEGDTDVRAVRLSDVTHMRRKPSFVQRLRFC